MNRRNALKTLAAGVAAAPVLSQAAIAAETLPQAAAPAAKPLHIAMVIFQGMTQLDFSAPFEVLARIPGAQVEVVAETLEPVASDTGLRLLPTHTFASSVQPDLLFVPGGPGQNAQMTNPAMIGYLAATGKNAAYVTSVCTGSLLLAAAGLLQGYKATCHWLSIDQLSLLGVVAQQQRVVVDRNRITGAGVTSGMDFALTVVAALRGDELARRLELLLEYDPQPPYRSGTPSLAGPAMVQQVRALAAPMLAQRRAQSEAAADNLRQRGLMNQ